MRSRRRPASLRALILSSMLPAAAGCAAFRPMPTIPTAFSCAALIPDSDRKRVAPTALPGPDATAGAMWIALDDQTARLDMANGHTADVVALMDRCEAERAKANANAGRGLLPLLRP